MTFFNKIQVSIVGGNLSFQLVAGVSSATIDIQILDSNGNPVLSSPYNQVAVPYSIPLQSLLVGNYVVIITENGNSESFFLTVNDKDDKNGFLPLYILSPMGGIVTLIQGRTIQTELTEEYLLDYVFREIKNSSGDVVEEKRRLNKNECVERQSDNKCVHNSLNRNLPPDNYEITYFHFEANGSEHESEPHYRRIV